MYIEIRKAGFLNKGAELMQYAVLQKMRQAYPAAHFVMAPESVAPYIKRAEAGFYQKAWIWQGMRFGVQVGDLAALAPGKLRKAYGVVLDKELDIVLDAAGFCYSEQWHGRDCYELAHASKRWRKQGTKVILLPQAFGPFISTPVKQALQTIVENVDLLFARERISYEHIVSVVGAREHIKIAPDFTNLVEGILPNNFDLENNRFCVIPNYRMIDKTPPAESSCYVPFMLYCVSYLLHKNLKPFILLHEGDTGDALLAKQIADATGGRVPIVEESNPLKIKGILGACEGVIGSRFHGLASALSQGVPVLATGWSHKYAMLLHDYGFPEGLIRVTAPPSEIVDRINSITERASRARITASIQQNAYELKQRSEKMWQDVLSVLSDI